MASNIPVLGYRDFGGEFSDDDNSAYIEWFIKDWSYVYQALGILLGNPYLGQMPANHPDLTGFYCRNVHVETIHGKSTQGSSTDYADLTTFLTTMPDNIVGFKVRATYHPWAAEGDVKTITDEQFDFSSQTMSLISNTPAAQAANSLHWEDGSLVTNLRDRQSFA